MQFLAKFGKIVCWRPPRGWRPTSGEILDPPMLKEKNSSQLQPSPHINARKSALNSRLLQKITLQQLYQLQFQQKRLPLFVPTLSILDNTKRTMNFGDQTIIITIRTIHINFWDANKLQKHRHTTHWVKFRKYFEMRQGQKIHFKVLTLKSMRIFFFSWVFSFGSIIK